MKFLTARPLAAALFLAASGLGAQTATPTPNACCLGVTALNGFLAPGGMAVDYPNQRLYVADFNNLQVQVFNSDTQAPLTILNTANSGVTFGSPIDVAVDGAGNLFVADIGAAQPIKKFDNTFTYLASIGPAGVTAQGVWADASSVFFSTSDGRVLQYNGSTTVYSAAATYGGPGLLNSPNQLQKIGSRLYVADTLNNRLVRFNTSPPDPAPTPVLTGLLSPSAFRTDPAGNLYLVEGNNGNGPEYLDEFSVDFSVKSQCAFPAIGIWGAAVNGLGQVYVSVINGASVTLMAGCGTTALPTATPTPTGLVPTGSPTPTPPSVPCDQGYTYPDPVTDGTMKVHLTLCGPGRLSLFLYNATGETVGQWSFNGQPGSNDLPLSLAGWASGVYFYRFEVEDPGGKRRLKPGKFAIR